MRNSTLLAKFDNILDSILSINIDQHRQNVEQVFPDLDTQLEIQQLDLHQTWANILTCSRSICEGISLIRDSQTMYRHIERVLRAYSQMNRAQQELNTSSWCFALSVLQSNLAECKSLLPPP